MVRDPLEVFVTIGVDTYKDVHVALVPGLPAEFSVKYTSRARERHSLASRRAIAGRRTSSPSAIS